LNEKLKQWFEFRNQAEGAVALYFYGDIVMDSWGKWADEDKHPQEVVDALKEADGKPLNIYINSGGGSTFAGYAIYNILNRYSAKKTVIVDGMAASAASVIAMAGDEIHIPKTAYLMIHKPWTSGYGMNADEFRKLADDLDVIEESSINAYEKKMVEGVTVETIKELVAAETWMTGDEAAKYFDIIVDDAEPVAACTSEFFGRYKNVPKELTKAEGQLVSKPEGKRQGVPDPLPKEQVEDMDIDKLSLSEELDIVGSFVFTRKMEDENEQNNERPAR
jgi:ATP-dependent protease ClpP protease subunit